MSQRLDSPDAASADEAGSADEDEPPASLRALLATARGRIDGARAGDQLDRAECRRRVGLVEQDAPVLAGTLLENIVYAAPQASAARVEHVIELASLSELIDRLPAGLDTQVGERGTLLSGGERQRLAIARALLPGPSLLLLDEPTAHLDAVSEAALVEAMDALAASTALLVIAHRLSTARRADQILLLDQGRVAAAGPHASLLADSAAYRALVAGRRQGASPLR